MFQMRVKQLIRLVMMHLKYQRAFGPTIRDSSRVCKGKGVIAFWAGPNLVVWARYAFWARGHVATNCRSKKNDAFEVKQELSKRIIELEKDFSKSEAKGIAFEIALQHKSRENNSLKTVQKENENFMASLQLENAHLKQTYKGLFESVQWSKVEIKQCNEVKDKDDFDEIETKNIELEYRVAS
ncbi:hypothetical protein Tco_0102049, partial [Tanacetum coccineum]